MSTPTGVAVFPRTHACAKKELAPVGLGLTSRFPQLTRTGSYNAYAWAEAMHQSVTMRVMAEKYEQLAKTAANPAERERFSEYVKLYREMEAHFAEAEKAEESDRKR